MVLGPSMQKLKHWQTEPGNTEARKDGTNREYVIVFINDQWTQLDKPEICGKNRQPGQFPQILDAKQTGYTGLISHQTHYAFKPVSYGEPIAYLCLVSFYSAEP